MSQVTVKDHGYAWVVLIAAYISNVIIGSLIMSPAVYMVDWVEVFETNSAQVGMAGSLWSAAACLTGLFLSPLINKIGGRCVQMIGAVAVFISLIITSFATSLYWIYISYGLIGGISLGMCFLPPMVIVQYYFDKRRGLASGISLAGHSSGTFMLMPLLRFLTETYGWRGALLIHSAIALNLLVTGSLFRPPNLPELNNKPHDNKTSPPTNSNDENLTQKSDITSQTTSTTTEKQTQQQTKDNKHNKCINSIITFFKTTWNFKLLVHSAFSRYLIALLLSNLTGDLVYKFTPLKAVHEGISKVNSSFLPSVIGFCSTGARIIGSLTADLPFVNRTLVFAVSVIALGVTAMASNFATNFTSYAVCVGAFGMALGLMMTLSMTVMVDLIGLKNLVHGSSFFAGATGIALIVSLPVAGFLSDTFNYDIPYYVYGTGTLLGGILALTLYFHQRKKAKMEKAERAENSVPVKLDSNPDVSELHEKHKNRLLNTLTKEEIIHASMQSLTCE